MCLPILHRWYFNSGFWKWTPKLNESISGICNPLYIILYCICSEKLAKTIVQQILEDASSSSISLNIAGDFPLLIFSLESSLPDAYHWVLIKGSNKGDSWCIILSRNQDLDFGVFYSHFYIHLCHQMSSDKLLVELKTEYLVASFILKLKLKKEMAFGIGEGGS